MSSESTSQTCSLLLKKWKRELKLTSLEKSKLSGQLIALDRQFDRLENKHIRLTVFGRVGVGKSSLLNALIGENIFATDIVNGYTRKSSGVVWNQDINNLNTIELVDTPGIDEIAANKRTLLASKIALNSDLVLLVLSSDITFIELEALDTLLKSGKPILIVLNRCDQWHSNEIENIIESIKDRLPSYAKQLTIESVAAAPRKAKISAGGKVRSEQCDPQVNSLKQTLLNLLLNQGNTLLTINSIRQAEGFYNAIKSDRLKRRKSEAQGLIGKFAALKASGVAVNPLLMFDFATGLALDTALIIQLSKLYGLNLKGHSARKLLKELSIQNSFLGGAQLGIQFTLGVIQHLLFLATPFTGGLSLAPAAPVAIAQAAVAVHTTKLTGRLVASELLQNSHLRGNNPRLILRHFARTNPNVLRCLNSWGINPCKETENIQSLLP